ncbi:MAG: DJ-1/PfpI family protein [Candidatus Heimdallarchaeota archaeon]
MRKEVYIIVILITILGVNLQGIVTPINSPSLTMDATENSVDILLLMDDGWGVNCDGIIKKMESYGWNITYGSTISSVTSCDLMGNDNKPMDVLVSSIVNVNQFDCISILPGEGYPHLYQNSQVNSLLQNALANNIYVSSWCKAIMIFADADIIDGKNVTGNIIYQGLAEAAGATFFPLVPPITDGYVITAVRSRAYQLETCIAIAQALGVYEANPPEVEAINFEAIGEDDYNVSVTLTDETDTISAKITLNALTEIIINNVVVTKYIRTLEDEDGDNTFEYIFTDLPAANYSVDIETVDAYWNEITYECVTIFNTLNTNGFGDKAVTIIAMSIGSFMVIFAVTNKIKRKKN